MKYRVVYGETMPAGERSFARKREAAAFAKKCERRGDVVFYCGLDEFGPPSLMGAIAASQTTE